LQIHTLRQLLEVAAPRWLQDSSLEAFSLDAPELDWLAASSMHQVAQVLSRFTNIEFPANLEQRAWNVIWGAEEHEECVTEFGRVVMMLQECRPSVAGPLTWAGPSSCVFCGRTPPTRDDFSQAKWDQAHDHFKCRTPHCSFKVEQGSPGVFDWFCHRDRHDGVVVKFNSLTTRLLTKLLSLSQETFTDCKTCGSTPHRPWCSPDCRNIVEPTLDMLEEDQLAVISDSFICRKLPRSRWPLTQLGKLVWPELENEIRLAQPVLQSAEKLKLETAKELFRKGRLFQVGDERFHELAVKVVLGLAIVDRTANESETRRQLADKVGEMPMSEVGRHMRELAGNLDLEIVVKPRCLAPLLEYAHIRCGNYTTMVDKLFPANIKKLVRLSVPLPQVPVRTAVMTVFLLGLHLGAPAASVITPTCHTQYLKFTRKAKEPFKLKCSRPLAAVVCDGLRQLYVKLQDIANGTPFAAFVDVLDAESNAGAPKPPLGPFKAWQVQRSRATGEPQKTFTKEQWSKLDSGTRDLFARGYTQDLAKHAVAKAAFDSSQTFTYPMYSVMTHPYETFVKVNGKYRVWLPPFLVGRDGKQQYAWSDVPAHTPAPSSATLEFDQDGVVKVPRSILDIAWFRLVGLVEVAGKEHERRMTIAVKKTAQPTAAVPKRLQVDILKEQRRQALLARTGQTWAKAHASRVCKQPLPPVDVKSKAVKRIRRGGPKEVSVPALLPSFNSGKVHHLAFRLQDFEFLTGQSPSCSQPSDIRWTKFVDPTVCRDLSNKSRGKLLNGKTAKGVIQVERLMAVCTNGASFVARVHQVTHRMVQPKAVTSTDLTHPAVQAELRQKLSNGWIPAAVDPGRRAVLAGGWELTQAQATEYLQGVVDGKFSNEFDTKLVITVPGKRRIYTFHHSRPTTRFAKPTCTVSNHWTVPKKDGPVSCVLFRSVDTNHYHRIVKQKKDTDSQFFLRKAKQNDIVRRFFKLPDGWKQVVFYGAAEFDHASRGVKPTPNVTFRKLALKQDSEDCRMLLLDECFTSQVASCCNVKSLISKGPRGGRFICQAD